MVTADHKTHQTISLQATICARPLISKHIYIISDAQRVEKLSDDECHHVTTAADHKTQQTILPQATIYVRPLISKHINNN